MSNSICYAGKPTNGQEPSSTFIENWMTPCGDTGSTVQMCCRNRDVCLSDSICLSTHPVDNGSGYYIGGCTDETYSDPVCSKNCGKSSLWMSNM